MTNCHQLKLKIHDGKYRLTVLCYIEARLGEKVVIKENTLNYQYIDDVKQIEK